MRRRKPPAVAPAPVPFAPGAARAHRAGLGLTPEQVAEGMAAHGVRLLPGHVLAWELGGSRPGEAELVALARALWCPVAELMDGRPASLRDHRLARELAQETVAERVGMAPADYRRAELTGHWDGDPDQTHALAQALGLRLTELVEATGRGEALDRLLRQCVTGRWQSQLRPIARLVPVPEVDLAAVLPVLHQEHHAPTYWGATARPRTATPPLTPRFWHLLSTRDPAVPV
ncbi:helix-turn-helix domain-containing protein [Kitasatospora sp. NPDC094011]|uniref:helix-turn-helix domain-containing protein n=1 Tax=Kitasatospora sp. NPDC094011 TaxID=3364090 RepID=UPI0038077829